MSWNINAIGLRAQVKEKVNADQNIPAGLRQTIADMCDDVTNWSTNGIRVSSYGHHGGGSGSIGKLKVEAVQILLPPEPKPENEQPASPPA